MKLRTRAMDTCEKMDYYNEKTQSFAEGMMSQCEYLMESIDEIMSGEMNSDKDYEDIEAVMKIYMREMQTVYKNFTTHNRMRKAAKAEFESRPYEDTELTYNAEDEDFEDDLEWLESQEGA